MAKFASRRRGRIAAAILLAVLPFTAGAADVPASGKPGGRIGEYLMSLDAYQTMYAVALEQDGQVGILCAETYDIRPLTIAVLTALEYPEGAAHPTTGAWQYRFEARRCGKVRLFNLMMIARAGEVPSATMLPPGKTVASPLAMRSAMDLAVASIGSGQGKGCKEINVLNTDVDVPAKKPGAAWTERWTMRACGKDVPLTLHFAPDDKGGTAVTLPAAKKAAGGGGGKKR
ncbi:MAG: hypothetical protein H7840_10935 [Alphaproteobacteria bacterium]